MADLLKGLHETIESFIENDIPINNLPNYDLLPEMYSKILEANVSSLVEFVFIITTEPYSINLSEYFDKLNNPLRVLDLQ